MKRFSSTPPSATSLSHFRLTSFASILFGIGVAIACGSSDGGSDSDGKDGKDGNGSGGSGQDSSIDGNDGLNLDGGGGEGNVNGVCGNGSLTQDEACDDGNTKSGDGCSADCLTVEPGFTCSVPGKACRPFARCGDGVVSSPEQCDDGDVDDGDGCSSTCKIEIGFKCSGNPSECDATTCGDFIIEGAETCDDGNALPYDGCNHLCQAEPQCGPSGCTSACGDGLVIDEDCDDGNTTSGDGCSATCEIEDNYTCETAPCERVGDQCVMRIPALFRDKNAGGDFQPSCSKDYAETGLVKTTLGADGTPEITAGDHSGACINDFSTWYHGDTGIVIGSLILFDNGSGGFVNRWKDDGTKYSYNGTSYDGNPFFFPIDNAVGSITPTNQYSNANTSADYGGGSSAGPHNFHFTSQIQYWFQYDQDVPLVLNFTGDDDVWVFINRKLAVDVGGLHPPRSGNVTINSGNAASYNLQDGKVYPISVFHAERKTDGSSFRLTLSGFDTGRSECKPNCGDGVIGAGEECDDGKNDGGYNECQPGCVLGGYCGDGIKQETEDCDDNAPDAPPSCRGCRLLVVK